MSFDFEVYWSFCTPSGDRRAFVPPISECCFKADSFAELLSGAGLAGGEAVLL